MVDCCDFIQRRRRTIVAQACARRLGWARSTVIDVEIPFGCPCVTLDIRFFSSSRIGLFFVDDTNIARETRNSDGERRCGILYSDAALRVDFLWRITQLFAVVWHRLNNRRGNLRKH